MSVSVTVEVNLDQFDDQDLVDELEGRGYYVGTEKGWEPTETLTTDEIDFIADLCVRGKPGSLEYFIYKKLKAV